MGQYGLNSAQRAKVRSMVENREDGLYVRDQIYDMSSSDGWNYDANVDFCVWLAHRGYHETAKYLKSRINNS